MSFQGAQEVAPSALPDRPLDRGDRLSTARDGRAEIALGGATLRLDEDTALTIADLDASMVRLQLDSGTASVHLHDLLDDETFEVVTLNTTVAFREPGEYRVDITPSGATESRCAPATRKSRRPAARCALPTGSACGSKAAPKSQPS